MTWGSLIANDTDSQSSADCWWSWANNPHQQSSTEWPNHTGLFSDYIQTSGLIMQFHCSIADSSRLVWMHCVCFVVFVQILSKGIKSSSILLRCRCYWTRNDTESTWKEKISGHTSRWTAAAQETSYVSIIFFPRTSKEMQRIEWFLCWISLSLRLAEYDPLIWSVFLYLAELSLSVNSHWANAQAKLTCGGS
jgi:hypothetical protein